MHVSHRVRIKPGLREVLGIPVFRHMESLRQACQKLRLPEPEWVEDYRMGMVDKQDYNQGKRGDVRCTGWAVQLPGWNKKIVFGKPADAVLAGQRFELNEAEEEPFFDNWPRFDESHVAVRETIQYIERRLVEQPHEDLTWEQVQQGMTEQGKVARRPGEGGRWGDLSEFDKLCDEYGKAATRNMMQDIMREAALHGEAVQQLEVTEDRVVLEILS